MSLPVSIAIAFFIDVSMGPTLLTRSRIYRGSGRTTRGVRFRLGEPPRAGQRVIWLILPNPLLVERVRLWLNCFGCRKILEEIEHVGAVALELRRADAVDPGQGPDVGRHLLGVRRQGGVGEDDEGGYVGGSGGLEPPLPQRLEELLVHGGWAGRAPPDGALLRGAEVGPAGAAGGAHRCRGLSAASAGLSAALGLRAGRLTQHGGGAV